MRLPSRRDRLLRGRAVGRSCLVPQHPQELPGSHGTAPENSQLLQESFPPQLRGTRLSGTARLMCHNKPRAIPTPSAGAAGPAPPGHSSELLRSCSASAPAPAQRLPEHPGAPAPLRGDTSTLDGDTGPQEALMKAQQQELGSFCC